MLGPEALSVMVVKLGSLGANKLQSTISNPVHVHRKAP